MLSTDSHILLMSLAKNACCHSFGFYKCKYEQNRQEHNSYFYLKKLGLTENDQKLEKDVQDAFNFLFTQGALMGI